MVSVGVAHDDVLDLRRIEPQFLEAVHDFLFDRVLKQRINHDDPLGRGNRPGSHRLAADVVQVVEDLGRLGVPLRSGRRVRASRSRLGGRGSGHRAKVLDHAGIVLPARGSGTRHVGLGGVCPGLGAGFRSP